MPEGQMQFKVDKTNLIKAGLVPVIAAAVGGLMWFLGWMGGLIGILFWVIAAFAGYWYVNLVLKSGVKPSILEVALNGAILGAVIGVVYAIFAWIAISSRLHGLLGMGYGWGFGSVIRNLFSGAIGGAIGAAGWWAYKSGMIKTK